MLAQKVPSLIPTENSQMHPLNLKKIFIPSLIWNWDAKTQPVFQEKQKKFFEKTVCLKSIPSLVPTWKGCLGTVILKKGKKICPPGMAGRDIAVKMPVKQRSCSDRSSFFFGVAIQTNCSIPYKSAKNIDFLLSLLYNYAVFLYLPESEGEKWI